MIKGRCFTDLDDYVISIDVFVEIPKIGHRVVCKKKGKETTLRVISITHNQVGNEPFIVVELHN